MNTSLKTIKRKAIPMIESCTQCNFEEPPSDDELLVDSNEDCPMDFNASSTNSTVNMQDSDVPDCN